MKDNEFEMMLNPVRFRIAQYVGNKGTATASELSRFLTDVPQASLYRHIAKLHQSGILVVVKEQKNRGAVEKTYAVSDQLYKNQGSNAEVYNKIQMILTSLMADYHKYMMEEENNPEADLLFVTASLFNANDGEFEAFIKETLGRFRSLEQNPPGEGRKLRKITMISSPMDKKEKQP